jgi:hypothetical protein
MGKRPSIVTDTQDGRSSEVLTKVETVQKYLLCAQYTEATHASKSLSHPQRTSRMSLILLSDLPLIFSTQDQKMKLDEAARNGWPKTSPEASPAADAGVTVANPIAEPTKAEAQAPAKDEDPMPGIIHRTSSVFSKLITGGARTLSWHRGHSRHRQREVPA